MFLKTHTFTEFQHNLLYLPQQSYFDIMNFVHVTTKLHKRLDMLTTGPIWLSFTMILERYIDTYKRRSIKLNENIFQSKTNSNRKGKKKSDLFDPVTGERLDDEWEPGSWSAKAKINNQIRKEKVAPAAVPDDFSSTQVRFFDILLFSER